MVNCNFTLFHCRLFGTKCDKCGNSFRKDDFVMRAKTKIYHIDCFRCSSCSRPLKPGMYCILQTLQHNLAKALTQIYVICFVRIPGDEFALRDGGSLFCKEDHDAFEKFGPPHKAPTIENINNNNNTNLSNNNHSSELGSMSGEW